MIVEPVVCWLLLGWVGGAGGREVPRDWWKAEVDVKDRVQGIHANDHKVPPVPEHHPCNSSPVKPRAHPRAIPDNPNNSPSKPLPRHTPGVVPAMVPTTVPTKFPASFLKMFSPIPPAPPGAHSCPCTTTNKEWARLVGAQFSGSISDAVS